MLARDLMTTNVVTATPETPLHDVARTLLDHGISALPVIDASGTPVGMVSEGDLIGREEKDRLARRDWWLALFAESDAHADSLPSRLQENGRCARDVMTTPVITVVEATEAGEIARILAAYHIKRVPVVRAGRLVGIVSRADLLRALTNAARPAPAAAHDGGTPGLLDRAIAALDEHFAHGGQAAASMPAASAPAAHAEGGPTAADLRGLAADFESSQARQRDEARRAAAATRQQAVQTLIDHHVGDESWKAILHHARTAAERGAKELLILRFPSGLCSDGGRAVNAPTPDWPQTLRGEAAEMYLRWERELKPRGFHLNARVLDFPGGMPGDIGLFIAWGE